MYIVRTSPMSQGDGARYLVEASKAYDTKYRLSKCAKGSAMVFQSRRTAQRWAQRVGGKAVAV